MCQRNHIKLISKTKKYTLHKIHHEFLEKLRDIYPEREIKSIFFIVLKSVLNFSNIEYIFHKHESIDANKLPEIKTIINRLKKNEPIQYILRQTEFCGISLFVNKHALIPRQETEELVEMIIKDVQEKRNRVNILDIGTGSGCIAIALKKKLPKSHVTAVDISRQALKVAIKNSHLLKSSILFKRVDILKKNHPLYKQKFHIIVSNPPYVLSSQKKDMHKNVLEYEPEKALFAPDKDPIIFYHKILEFSKKHLATEGSIFFEINPMLKNEIIDKANSLGFKQLRVVKDMNGKERFIIILKEKGNRVLGRGIGV